MLALAGAAAVAFSLPLVWWAVSGPRRSGGARNLSLTLGITDMRQAVLAHSSTDRLQPLVRALAGRARRLTPVGMVDRLDHRILLAGAPALWTVERLLAAKLVLGAIGLAFGLLRFLGSPSSGALLLTLVLVAVGYLAPELIISSRASERQKQIRLELPDTLDQITIAVEAGLGFDAAAARAARSGHGPLAQELSRMLQDVRAGMSRSEALRRLVGRTDVAELRHVVLALLQADSYGVPIAQVLRVQSGELRVKRRQQAEERAMKIPVKLVFPVVLCILPTLFIVVIGPAAIRLVRQFAGGGL
ncbi:MAG: type II secretion system F family protein [Actinomycetota bacterium]|nr:type II secretion system F family protein [Actinomycetota bacterium]PLS75357.1 MAG: secretion system protein [Actinomycetota bacterium]